MDRLQERLEHVRVCSEERAQLQANCFKELDLEGCETGKDIGKLRFTYEKCVRENTANYPCLAQREEVIKGNL
jgi:hypothetical protein